MVCATCGTSVDFYPNYLGDNNFCRYECMVQFLGHDPNESEEEESDNEWQDPLDDYIPFDELDQQELFNQIYDDIYEDTDFTIENKECNICLEVKNTRNTEYCCKVNHICADCLKGVLTTNGDAPCPFCRSSRW